MSQNLNGLTRLVDPEQDWIDTKIKEHLRSSKCQECADTGYVQGISGEGERCPKCNQRGG